MQRATHISIETFLIKPYRITQCIRIQSDYRIKCRSPTIECLNSFVIQIDELFGRHQSRFKSTIQFLNRFLGDIKNNLRTAAGLNAGD